MFDDWRLKRLLDDMSRVKIKFKILINGLKTRLVLQHNPHDNVEDTKLERNQIQFNFKINNS